MFFTLCVCLVVLLARFHIKFYFLFYICITAVVFADNPRVILSEIIIFLPGNDNFLKIIVWYTITRSQKNQMMAKWTFYLLKIK